MVAHVTHATRTPLSRSEGQGHQAVLLTAALTRQQAAAAVSVGTYWAWEHCYVPVCRRRRRGASAPREGGEGWGILWRPPAYSLLNLLLNKRQLTPRTVRSMAVSPPKYNSNHIVTWSACTKL